MTMQNMSSEELLKDINNTFPKKNIEKFNHNQESIIRSILSGDDVMAILPTGGGKSLCFQYPAMKLGGITIVVSPLIALMEDQVESLNENGIKSVSLNSDNNNQMQKMRNAIAGKYKLLYVSPERLLSPKFMGFTKKLEEEIGISLLVIDEAHCISLWGYDFRPSYLNIRRFINILKKRPIITAFTATASKYIARNIIDLLQMKGAEPPDGVYERENLQLSVKTINEPPNSDFTQDFYKYKPLYEFLEKHKNERGIIYCSTIDLVKSVHKNLLAKGYAAAPYFADFKDKSNSYSAFKNGKCNIIVATKAFGMGIDISNVRFVVHFDMPNDLESYYQEIGRAGRDNKPADCLLFYSEADEADKRERSNYEIKNNYNFIDDDMNEILKELNQMRLWEMIKYGKNGSGKSSTALQKKIVNYYKSSKIEDFLEERGKPLKEKLLNDLNEIGVLYTNETKIANILRKNDYQLNTKQIVTVGNRDKKEIKASFDIDKELSYFDLMVADAVYTLHVWGKTIYPKSILELLSGDATAILKSEKPSNGRKSMRTCIVESLDKMRGTQINIEQNDGMMGNNFEDTRVFNGRFLPLDKGVGENSYTLSATPPLYKYAELNNGQFFAIPNTRLHIMVDNSKTKDSKPMPNSMDNLMLRHFIARRITLAKPKGSSERMSRSIRFTCNDKNRKGMFDILQIEITGNKYEQKRKRDTVYRKIAAILDDYKEKNIIQNYDFLQHGDDINSNINTIVKWNYLPITKEKEITVYTRRGDYN